MRNRVKKIICLVFALLFIVTAFSFSSFAGVLANNPMKDTSVEDDLEKLGVNTSDYGLDTTADFVSVLDFVEYGYDAGGNQEYYGLFVYVYNPSGKEIRGAYLQMQYTKKDGSETGYKKYRLVEVDCNDESTDCPYTLYKFVVKDSADIAKNVPYAVRTYCVSGIEIRYSITDSSNAIDYEVSGKWTFRGYQENCGREGDTTSTLTCSYEVQETIRTELHSVSWFSKTSDLGADYRYEVSSVYFNIPNYYISKYGDINAKNSGLVAVQGEYYKYVTNGLAVPDNTWYEKFKRFENSDISLLNSYNDKGWITINEYPGFYCVDKAQISADYFLIYNYRINRYDITKNIVRKFANLVVSSVNDSDSFYVSSNDLYDAVFQTDNYKYYHNSEYLLTVNREFFNELGKQSYNISVNDEPLNDRIKTFSGTKYANWLHKLFHKELYVDENGYPNIEALIEIKDSDILSGDSDTVIGERLFVIDKDVDELKAFYRDNREDNHIYLMRFDANPYLCSKGILTDDSWNDSSDDKVAYGYYFEKVIYKDFDILSFTFKDAANKVVTVPVSCDPINIVGSVIPGPDDGDNNGNLYDDNKLSDVWDLILKVFGIVAGVVIFVVIFVFLYKKFDLKNYNKNKLDRSLKLVEYQTKVFDLDVKKVKERERLKDRKKELTMEKQQNCKKDK